MYGRLGMSARRPVALNWKQFGEPIAKFGAIRRSWPTCPCDYGVESALFRTTGLIDERIGGSHDGASWRRAQEFAPRRRCSRSEQRVVDFAVDENVQIHGGNGFVADYPGRAPGTVTRASIAFEGTNGSTGCSFRVLIKRAPRACRSSPQPKPRRTADGAGPPIQAQITPLANERRVVASRKTVPRPLVSRADRGESLREQEALIRLTIIDTFIAESATLRAAQRSVPAPAAALHLDAATVIARCWIHADATARTLLASMQTGDALRTSLAGLRRILKVPPVNTVAARRRIADAITDRKAYPFGSRT